MLRPLATFPAGFRARPMVRGDLRRVVRVERACYTTPWTRPLFEGELDNAVSRSIVVEDATGTIVAHAVFWVVHDELHLLNIAVAPSQQRQGLASAMLSHLFEVCAAERLIYVGLEVREKNLGARRLYERYGFREVGRRLRYYPDTGETAIVMAVVIDEA